MSEAWEDILLEMDSKLIKFAEQKSVIITFVSKWIFSYKFAIHNFKWVNIIQIWQNGGQLFSQQTDWCHFLYFNMLVFNVLLKNKKTEYNR